MVVGGIRVGCVAGALAGAVLSLAPPAWAQQEWRQNAKLVANNGDAVDFFGTVAVSENTLVVGADSKEKPSSGTSPGAAYVFVRSGDSWTQQGPALFASDATGYEAFGRSTAIVGDTIAVGAPYKPVSGKTYQGGAYVFTRAGSQWTQQGNLVASDGAASDFFGNHIALGIDTLLVGAGSKTVGGNVQQGAAYVFARTSSKWAQQGTALTASDGAAFDQFGAGLAISGDLAFVGAPAKQIGANAKQGAVYVFRRAAGVWTQQGAALLASDGAADDWFGYAIAVQNDVLMIGAYNKAVGGLAGRGAVYVFARNGDDWTQQGAPLTASDGASGDWFGVSLALRGDLLAVGAAQLDVGDTVDQGGGYVFARTEGVWAQQGGRLISDHGGEDDWFGHFVGLSDGMAIFGARFQDVDGEIGQGAVYVYKRGDALGTECASGATCSSSQCVDGVCCENSCGGACDACSVSAGSQQDGACLPLANGSVGAPSCGQLICDGVNHDCSGCAHDSDCAADHFCNAAQQCEPQRAQGAQCNPQPSADCHEGGCDICQSGQCVDGVCCATSCTSVCMACSQERTGGGDGTCAAVLSGTDPRSDCDESPDTCGYDGLCNGAGSCRLAKADVVCGNTSCQNDNTVSGLVCDGAGSCLPTVGISCAPYACSGGACTVPCAQHSDCFGDDTYCLDGACHYKLPVGQPCASQTQCDSGFCVEGVCCNGACDGECESCTSGACAPDAAATCLGDGGAGGGGGDAGSGGGSAGSATGGSNTAGSPAAAGTTHGGSGGVNASGSAGTKAGSAGATPQTEGGCSGDECSSDDPPGAGTRDSNGCGCRMGAKSSVPGALAWCALLLALASSRRRRAA